MTGSTFPPTSDTVPPGSETLPPGSDTVKGQVQVRRQHKRTPTGGQVLGQVVDADDPALIGYTFHSSILEISPCGLRLVTDTMISGCRIDLWVEIDGHSKKLFLTTDVRWVGQEESGYYQVGVEITDNPLADMTEWCEFQRKEWFLHKNDQAD